MTSHSLETLAISGVSDDDGLVPVGDLKSQPQEKPPPQKPEAEQNRRSRLPPGVRPPAPVLPVDKRRFRQWLKMIQAVGVIRWIRHKAMAQVLRADEFLWVFFGPRTNTEQYRKRMDVCVECNQRDGMYCKPCKCGKWSLARLDRKNRYARWNCPLGKHEGSTVAIVSQPAPSGGGCKGGCNGK